MKSLPSVRLTEESLNHIHQAIAKYNKSNLFAISLAEFRRLALEVLAQMILQDIPLPVSLK